MRKPELGWRSCLPLTRDVSMRAHEDRVPNSSRRQALAPKVDAADAAAQAQREPARAVTSPASLIGLQHTAGNRAATRFVEGKPVASRGDDLQHVHLQRDDAPAPGTTDTAPKGSEWAPYREEMEGIRARATARELQATACVGLAADVLSSLRAHLETISTVYGTAYKTYSEVIEKGKAAAKTEEELIDIGVGILLAVAIGTGVGAGAAALELGEGLAIEAAKEAITATSAELAKSAGKHLGLLEVVGTDLEPGGLKPEVMKLHLWEQMVDLHSRVLTTVRQADFQSLIASGAEYAIGEIKAQISGGAGADLQVSVLHDLIGTLANDDGASASLDTSLSAAISHLQDVRSKLGSAPDPHGREMEMERDIWILWMADLPEEHAKDLDRDPIEDHLQELRLITSGYSNGGLLGVDTGIWTTKADCLKMIESAKNEAAALREKYGSVTG